MEYSIEYDIEYNIEYGVPQGSILGLLLFNIDLIDLFFECDDSETASYVNDTTPYACTDDIPASKRFSWFINNHMKVNPGKCHILLSTKNTIDVILEGACITSSSCEKLLGVTIDSD